MRWVALATAMVLFPLAYKTGETVEAVLAFFAGALSGLFLDLLGVRKLKLWNYPRQPFLSKKYFSIVVPAWGVFGMTINLLWAWFGGSTVPLMVLVMFITLGLLIVYEFPNLNSKSWEYYASFRVIIPGWFPMILFFRIAFLALPVIEINDVIRSVFLR